MKQIICTVFLLLAVYIIEASEKNALSLDWIACDPLFSQSSFKEMLTLSQTSTFWNQQVVNSVHFCEKFFDYYEYKKSLCIDEDEFIEFKYYPITHSIFSIISANNLIYQGVVDYPADNTLTLFCFFLSDAWKNVVKQSLQRDNNKFLNYLDKKIDTIANESHFMWNRPFNEFIEYAEGEAREDVSESLFTSKYIYFKNLFFDDYIILWFLNSQIFSSKFLTIFDSSGNNIVSTIEKYILSNDWKNHLQFFEKNNCSLKKYLKNNSIITYKLKKMINVFYWFNSFEKILLLLNNGADPGVALESNGAFFFSIILVNEPRFLKLFLQHGIYFDKNLEDKLFKNAILKGREKIISLLLKYSPNKEQLIYRMEHSDLPIIFFALQFSESTRLLKLLLVHGFSPNVIDEYGNHLLKKAIQFQNTTNIQLLLEYGADLESVLKNGIRLVSFTKYKVDKLKILFESFLSNVQLKKLDCREYFFSMS